MTKQQNIALARKYFDEEVYSAAKIDNVNITFPQAQTILQGVNIPGVTLRDLEKIINLRDAWKYILVHLDEKFNLSFICKINAFVARNYNLEWGVLRTGGVRISGVDYIPPVPEKDTVEAALQAIMGVAHPVDKAFDYFLYATRNQLFWDGNKRTSLICANKILIDNGEGILLVKDNDLLEFNKQLQHYYQTGEIKEIKFFLHEKCLQTLDLTKSQKTGLDQ